MRALVLCDDYWHPAATPRNGLSALSESGITFDWIEDAKSWSSERMSEYPLVILTKSNNVSATNPVPWMTPAVEDAFVSYVNAGNGLLVIHSGAAGYQENLRLRALMGGVFLQHPAQCDVTHEPLIGHPLTGGVSVFTERDEHYHMAMDDTNADVFLTSRSEHGEQPAGWTRREGAGRVCMLTPGHNLEVWLHPMYQKLLQNVMEWCVHYP